MFELQEMRSAYCETMMEMAEREPRIVVLHADLCGAHGMNPFAKKYPDRSYNVGVAEANMIGVSAGLAASGKIPFAHSFATFSTRRCFDQIAISVSYANLNVRIIGSDPGVGAELNGGTHMALEDVGIMRTLPGMVIIDPADSVQLKAMLPEILYHKGPVYIRLFRKKTDSVFQPGYQFRLGKADVFMEGRDVALLTTGVCVANTLKAAEELGKQGIRVGVVNIHTIKPLDAEAVIRSARISGALVTVENHSIIGGLGSAVSEILAEECPAPLVRLGVQDHFGKVGKKEYLVREFGLTVADIVAGAHRAIQKKRTAASDVETVRA